MTLPSNKKEVILGQLLNEKVQCLKSQVQALFPNKKYHIGKLANAMEEQGKEVRTERARYSKKRNRPLQEIVAVLPSYYVPFPESFENVVYATGISKEGLMIVLGNGGKIDGLF